MTASLVLLFLIGTACAARPVQIEEDPLAEGEEAIGEAISQEPWGQRLRNLLAPPSWFYGSRPTNSHPTFSQPTYSHPSYFPSSQPAYSRPSYGTATPSTRPSANSNAVANGPQGSCRRGDRSAAALIACTNAFRANPSMSKCGGGMRPVGPLKANSQLMSAAQGHSEAMARARSMSHTLGGSTMSSRIRRAGYPGGTMAENIAAGHRDAYSVVESWMCSSGHRKNMMSCKYADLGVGISCGSQGCYWTQNFGCAGGCGCNGGGSTPSTGGYPTSRPQPSYGYPRPAYSTSRPTYSSRPTYTSRPKYTSYPRPTYSSRYYG